VEVEEHWSCSLLNRVPVPQLIELITTAVNRKRYFQEHSFNLARQYSL